MLLEVVRYSETRNFNGSTFGVLLLDGKFEAYTLEDEHRDFKVMSETCIPEGVYDTEIATWGELHERYTRRWPAVHRGLIMLRNVPNFTGILLHCGYSEADTAGCILIGDCVNNNVYARAELTRSWDAYLRVYQKALPAAKSGELRIAVRSMK